MTMLLRNRRIVSKSKPSPAKILNPCKTTEDTSTSANWTNHRQRDENNQSKQHESSPQDMNNIITKSGRLVRKNIFDRPSTSPENIVRAESSKKVHTSSGKGKKPQKKIKPTPTPSVTAIAKPSGIVTKSGRVVKKKNLDFGTTPSPSKTDNTIRKESGNINVKFETKSTKGEVLSLKSGNKRKVKTKSPNVKSNFKSQLTVLNKGTSKILSSTPKNKTIIITKSPRYKPNLTPRIAYINESESPKGQIHGAKNPISKICKVKANVLNPKTSGKKVLNKNLSFKLLEDGGKPRTGDVYEFTFDPSEEPPPPQKKKRKRIVKKKSATLNTFFTGSNYEKNISRALSSLKSIVSKKKPMQPILETENTSITEQNNEVINNAIKQPPNIDDTSKDVTVTTSSTSAKPLYNSVRVEDIATNFEPSIDEHHEIDYSPVNSPTRVKTPTQTNTQTQTCKNTLNRTNERVPMRNSNGPLNLLDDLSFFEEPPVANSSMISVRDPEASPWRVEFEKLPIKWHINTYVKPNMTPAIESSFINFDEGKKKHVYTNMVPQNYEVSSEVVADKLQQISETRDAARYRQPSIISFIKEVAERSAKKKTRSPPVKHNSIFDDITSTPYGITERPHEIPNPTENESHNHTSKETTNTNTSESNEDKENSKENRKEVRKNRKRKKYDVLSEITAKSPRNKEKENTFFGFDDTEEDLENITPVRNKRNKHTIRPHSRTVLQELNAQAGPMRAMLAAKSKIGPSSEIVNKLYDELKSGTVAPEFPENEVVEGNMEMTNFNGSVNDISLQDDDSQSVHLFEDVEVVHHLKPVRKSYNKAKKVTFQQHSVSDSEDSNILAHMPERADDSDNDDLADLSFKLPKERQKRTKKKQTKKDKMRKKEEEEADAWAASFNAMCEDVDEFLLVVE